jgi:hypothetical protein
VASPVRKIRLAQAIACTSAELTNITPTVAGADWTAKQAKELQVVGHSDHPEARLHLASPALESRTAVFALSNSA